MDHAKDRRGVAGEGAARRVVLVDVEVFWMQLDEFGRRLTEDNKVRSLLSRVDGVYVADALQSWAEHEMPPV